MAYIPAFIFFFLLFSVISECKATNGTEANKTENESLRYNLISKVAVIDHWADFWNRYAGWDESSVKTFASLSTDPVAALPMAFTICSTISSPITYKYLSLFNLYGKNNEPWITVNKIPMDYGMKTPFEICISGLCHAIDTNTPFIFPTQWTQSCTAIDGLTGVVTVIVNGLMIENKTIELDAASNHPTNLTGKLVVGKDKFGYWYEQKGKLTNLNVFKRLLSIPSMVKMTKYECGTSGDYLAWTDMEWDLHGNAIIEEVNRPCPEKELIVYTQVLEVMENCLGHCACMNGRVPPIGTLEEWNKLWKGSRCSRQEPMVYAVEQLY